MTFTTDGEGHNRGGKDRNRPHVTITSVLVDGGFLAPFVVEDREVVLGGRSRRRAEGGCPNLGLKIA